MFNKKYSPVVLPKASMFAFHLMERGVKFVLQDKFIRLLHLTIDETRWSEPNPYSSETQQHKSEFHVSVLCQDEKVIEIEAEITLLKRNDGDWIMSGSGLDAYRFRFPNCKALKGAEILFRGHHETGEICNYDFWVVNKSSKTGASPTDKIMCEVRSKLFT